MTHPGRRCRRAAAVLVAALAASALAGAAACSRGGAPAARGPAPVARVNGEPLPAAAVRAELAQLAAGEAAPQAPSPELRRRALDAAVDRALLVQAARARGIQVTDEERDRAFAAMKAEYPDRAFDELLAQQRTTEAEWKERLREQLLVERVVAAELAAVKVSDADVRAYHDAHADEFRRGEEVHARQVVTRTREEAEKARAEIVRRPASFPDVARRVSIAPEARAGGDLGWFGKDSGMPEPFLVCLSLRRDEVSKVVASPYGFHVFQVVDRRPAGRRPFEAVAAEIGQRLLAEKRARAQEDFLAKLRGAAKIEVDEAALDAALREAPR